MIANGQFREDFFYRVSVIPIHVPPLRARKKDIEPLARHFLQKYALQIGKSLHDFESGVLNALLGYSWPGNVRELENAIERAVAISNEPDGVVRLKYLPETVTGFIPGQQVSPQFPAEGIDFEAHIAQVEKQYLIEALRVAGGIRTRAAELLRMSYRSFRHYAKKFEI
jgi:two-component system response regulator PilR (NtrC family)